MASNVINVAGEPGNGGAAEIVETEAEIAETHADASVEIATAQVEAAVKIAEIEAERDVELAEIAADQNTINEEFRAWLDAHGDPTHPAIWEAIAELRNSLLLISAQLNPPEPEPEPAIAIAEGEGAIAVVEVDPARSEPPISATPPSENLPSARRRFVAR